MRMNELITNIENSYYRYFPDSKIFVKFSTFYPSISVKCYLAGDKTENISNYWNNDILNIQFMISGENFREFSRDINQESELNIVSLENNYKSYHIKPDSPYMVYSRRKLSFRKVQGNSEKIIKSLDDFFKKLKKSLLDDLNNGNIHKNHLDIARVKLN